MVGRRLDKLLNGRRTVIRDVDLARPHSMVVFSDMHKGAGDPADEFLPCKPAYCRALRHYRDAGFTLVLLGDAEDLWEQDFPSIERQHKDVLALEGSFPKERHIRVYGNHDLIWKKPNAVRRFLKPYLPAGLVAEAVRLNVWMRREPIGTLFLLHGHQGTWDADRFYAVSWITVRLFWKPLQNWFGVGKETPAENACLRGKYDHRMYAWASRKSRLILIAGHTHRPVWSSRTHLQKLEEEYHSLVQDTGSDRSRQKDRLEALRAEIDVRRLAYPPCNDTVKPKPCYFNTGCCKFRDGDVTGIEIVDGELRLVKWPAGGHPGRRTVLERGALLDFFKALS